MRTLNIIESLYSGVPYSETEKARLTDDLVGDYEFSRFKTNIDKVTDIKIVPYLIDFERYKLLLSRVKLIISFPVDVDLKFYSSEGEFNKILVQYIDGKATLLEPTNISDLLYDTDCGTYLTPLGILAFLFRRSYGNEKFRQYINSTILKQYFKVNVKNSPTFYFYKDCSQDMKFIKQFGELFVTDRWDKIRDYLIQSPFIYSWRD